MEDIGRISMSLRAGLLNSAVFVADTATGRLLALTAKGTQSWATDLQLGSVASGVPAISANGAVVYAMGNHQTVLYALNGTNGTVIWSAPLPAGDFTDGSPVVTPTSILVEGASGGLYGFDPGAGAAQAMFARAALPAGGGLLSSPSFGGGSIVLAGRSAIEAVNSKTGAVRWRVALPADAQGDGYPSVAIANGVVYATAGSALLAFNLKNGAVLLDCQNPTHGAYTSPVPAMGLVYFLRINTGADSHR